MSLVVENYRVLYNANGVQTSFAIPQTFFSDNDNLLVYVIDESVDPVDEDLQVEGVDYSISGTNVVFGSAPANGRKVGIFRELDIEQALDLIPSGPLNLNSLEDQLDKIIAISQQLNGAISRALKVRKSSLLLNLELPEPEAGKALAWNLAEDGLENVDYLLGNGGTTKVWGEAPSGAINNTNLAFTIANAPAAGTFRLYQNGRRTADFSLVGTNLTLGVAPGFAGELLCDYEY
jgi:hypothetical protein